MGSAKLKKARQPAKKRAALLQEGPMESEEPSGPPPTRRPRKQKMTVLPSDDPNEAGLLLGLSHPPKSNAVLEREREEQLKSWVSGEIDCHAQPKANTKGVCSMQLPYHFYH